MWRMPAGNQRVHDEVIVSRIGQPPHGRRLARRLGVLPYPPIAQGVGNLEGAARRDLAARVAGVGASGEQPRQDAVRPGLQWIALEARPHEVRHAVHVDAQRLRLALGQKRQELLEGALVKRIDVRGAAKRAQGRRRILGALALHCGHGDQTLDLFFGRSGQRREALCCRQGQAVIPRARRQARHLGQRLGVGRVCGQDALEGAHGPAIVGQVVRVDRPEAPVDLQGDVQVPFDTGAGQEHLGRFGPALGAPRDIGQRFEGAAVTGPLRTHGSQMSARSFRVAGLDVQVRQRPVHPHEARRIRLVLDARRHQRRQPGCVAAAAIQLLEAHEGVGVGRHQGEDLAQVPGGFLVVVELVHAGHPGHVQQARPGLVVVGDCRLSLRRPDHLVPGLAGHGMGTPQAQRRPVLGGALGGVAAGGQRLGELPGPGVCMGGTEQERCLRVRLGPQVRDGLLPRDELAGLALAGGALDVRQRQPGAHGRAGSLVPGPCRVVRAIETGKQKRATHGQRRPVVRGAHGLHHVAHDLGEVGDAVGAKERPLALAMRRQIPRVAGDLG